MKNEIVFSMESPFRDTFRIQGFRFGEGEKSLALVGAMRGNEIQQQYICSQTVCRLAALEKKADWPSDMRFWLFPPSILFP